jgi:hypothetical protein
MGCDPIAGMAAIATDEKQDIALRAAMYKELAQYVAPITDNSRGCCCQWGFAPVCRRTDRSARDALKRPRRRSARGFLPLSA